MSTKKIRTERTAADYDDKTDIEHVYDIPDMYIGSTDPEEREDFLLNMTTMKLEKHKISISRSVERLFLEILSNAGDNADSSRSFKVNPGSIDVTMDREWITVRNHGKSIPVEPSKNHPDKVIPDIIFGKLRSSSNYDTNVIRMGCGRNGLGAKLTNIFSKEFKVTVGDNTNKKLYNGVWKNNMKEGPTSTIKSYSEKDGFVEVSWRLDFERFGLKEYPDEAFNLFARYVVDFSLTCKVPVSFNGVVMDMRNIRDYAAMYWTPEDCDKAIVHHEWPKHNKENPNGVAPFATLNIPTREKMICEAAKPEHIPIIELLILDTPDAGECLSYVNGLLTIDGGVHVNEVFASLTSQILNNIEFGKNKGNKNDETKIPRITNDDVKRHVSVIINCRLPDPKYSSQTKTKVTSPKPHAFIPEKIGKVIATWNLVARLYAALEAKMYNVLKKTNGGKAKHIDMDAGEDANDAGTDKSGQCILYLVEGKSASSYPKKRIVMTPGGKDLSGYYPLRGKFMNVRNADIQKIANNKEIKSIKTMLGLREEVDYTKDEELATLRYGYIMICVDADSDGFHIASLLINYIGNFYPGLLYKGRVGILRTPVVRVFDSKNAILHRFYNNSDFERWQGSDEGRATKTSNIVYYKGLGTSEDRDIKDDLTSAPVVTVVYDEYAAGSLTLAFDKTLADKRKEWIGKWREVSHIADVIFEKSDSIFKEQKITDFINHELIDYTKDALFRAIPSQDDGLKRSHRQALYSALKYFNYGRKSDVMKVAQFANYASKETNYHHGDMSMCDTVIKMAQDYTGANNLPWFQGKGQFGTRSCLGEDAASPRYLFMCLPKYAGLLYDEELINCVPKRVVEGEEVEPLFVPGTIPMHLVNGVMGIATGYSSFIPNHSYYDVIEWCKNKCKGTQMIIPNGVLKPWYKGFTGKILFADTDVEDEQIPGAEYLAEDEEKADEMEEIKKVMKPNGLSVITLGKCEFQKDKKAKKAKLIITEIPIGVSMEKYVVWLKMLLKEKVISDFRDVSKSTEQPHYIVEDFDFKGKTINHKNLHLEKSMALTNITMIDQDGYPTKFGNTSEVMEVYATRMLGLYTKVREARIKRITEKIEDLNHRIRFISLVVENKLVIFKRPKKDVIEDMTKQKPAIPEKYLGLVKASEFTNEELKASYDEITALQEEYKVTLLLKSEDLWYDKLVKLEEFLKKNKY